MWRVDLYAQKRRIWKTGREMRWPNTAPQGDGPRPRQGGPRRTA